MNSEPFRGLLETCLGAALVTDLGWLVFASARIRRGGPMTRKIMLLTIISNLPFFGALLALFLLVWEAPVGSSAAGLACMGGLAMMFLVLHAALIPLGSRKGRAWLEGGAEQPKV